jgi:hypothetical protein
MEPIRSHDALFKFVFGEPEQMAELLLACLPPDIASAVDLSTLRRLDSDLVDDELKQRRLDLAFEVKIAGVWTLLPITEHKSGPFALAAFQIAGYEIRLIERWRRLHPEHPGLPAVLPLVFHHGPAPWRGPRSLLELVDFGADADSKVAHFLRPLQLNQQFLLFDLAALSEADVDRLRLSAVASLTLRFLQFLRHCPAAEAPDRILGWRRLLVALLEHPRGQDVLRALFSWFFASVPSDHAELRILMSKPSTSDFPVHSMLDLLEERGVERGLERGLQNGFQRLFLSLLRQRFGPLDASTEAKIAGADAATIERWSLRLWTAASVDAVLANP